MLYLPKETKKKYPMFEEYYGTSGNIQKAQYHLDKIVNKIHSMGEIEAQGFNFNATKDAEEFCNALTKEFGFKETVAVFAQGAFPNAISLIPTVVNQRPGIKYMMEGKPKLEKYYDKYHMYRCHIMIWVYFIKHSEFTPREVMSLLLHEVGHNFDPSISTTAFCVSSIFLTCGMSEIEQLLMALDMRLRKNKWYELPYLFWLLELIQFVNMHLMSWLPIPFGNLIQRMITDPIGSFLRPLLLYNAEKFSDSFAAKYGYGPDLASAFTKMDYSKTGGYVEYGLYQIPPVRTMLDIMKVPAYTLYSLLFDEHPLFESRIMNVRDELENDYRDPEIPKELKPEIKRQIDQIDKLIEKDAELTANRGLYMLALRKVIMYSIRKKK